MKRVEKIRAFWFALGLSMICMGVYLTFVGYLTQISIGLIFSGVGIAMSGLAYYPSGEGERQRDLRTRFKQYRDSYKSTGGKLALVGLGFVLSGLFTFGLLFYLVARAEHHYVYPVSPVIPALFVMTVLLLLPGFVLVSVGFIMAKIDQYQRKTNASS